MGWLEFVNEESRERLHRLRVMTDPEQVRTVLVERLAARFDLPLETELVCAVEDVDAAEGTLDLVPLAMSPDAYEVLGPIRVAADEAWMPGSTVEARLVVTTRDRRLVGRAREVSPRVAVTT